MKTSEFKLLIQSVVQEELKKSLPLMIPKILTEILSNKIESKVLHEHSEVSTVSTQPKAVKKEEKKQIKKYTNNDLLNQVLNETVGGIPKEGSYVSLSSPMMSETSAPTFNTNPIGSTEKLNESVIIPPTPTPVNQEQAKVLDVMTRDFRSLMKAVDKKKKQGNINSGLVQIE